ncbi:class II aldolase/adducin family protein [Parvularcula dongshanensis]|uniref:Ribulose-5-phosphate 4-epimerase/fuculose-1-phosphate aldolase n=1 Tax=Parvularcula dongshanensis TaxID=1173995 RepID=A0A840HYU6_9PROT|nr:class II aldolase/adducin family protein [Parvularcula dongshanensis]MBB4657749.1 ribulose-5-phosphate 4-epimerase/fuculose-1-phosphate aldolase [Parvularcula dongshanensis]
MEHHAANVLAGVGAGFDLPDPASLPSLNGKVSDHEWQIRCELAATYRLAALYGWDDLVFTHISARLPDEDGEARFLINPYGALFEEMTASSLVKIDMEGRKVVDSPYFTNPAGFVVHSAVHLHRHDAGCVLHLHSPYGVAVSAQKGGLHRYTQFAMIVIGDLAYHDYEGIALESEERERLVRDLGQRHMMMLRNHGTLTLGENCALAFLRMYILEQACRTQILAQAAGDDALLEDTEEMADLVGRQGAPGFTKGLGDNLTWPALMRKLSRQNPGWDR